MYVTPPEQSISGSSKTMILLSRVVDEADIGVLGEDCEDILGVELKFSLDTIELANIATQAMMELSSLICAACNKELLDVLLMSGFGLTACVVEWELLLLACACTLLCELLPLNAKDNELFQVVTDTSIKCHNALVGHLSAGGGKASRDLDGTTYMKGIKSIIEEGMKYLEHANANPNSCPAEPLNFTLTTVRELLGLVGFSDKTCNAGKERHMPGQLGVASTNTAKNHALIDEIVAFRTAIRSSAISGIRNNDGTEAIKNILRICDAFRDQVMPSMGIEILDGKTQGDSGAAGSWRNCAPKEDTSDEK